MDTYLVVELGVIALALVILGLAAWVEASLGTARELTIRELLSNRLSRSPESEVDETTQLRSAMLLIQVLAAGVATALIAHLALDLEMPGLLAAGIIAGSVAHVLIGRVLPGFFATTPDDVNTSMTARIGRILRLVFFPVIWPLERLQRSPNRHPVRRDELSADEAGYAAESETESDANGQQYDRLDADEHEMISGVLQLVNATADDIMVPRLDLVAVPKSATIAETVDVAITAGHSRIPVYNDNIDEIVGIIYAKDLLRFVNDGDVEETIEDEIRPAYFVPESKRADELLHELQMSKVHLAIVVDEYGGTAGVVTIEDILEEIVGEIEDEYDRELPRVEQLDESSIAVDGRLLVEDVLDALDLYWEERPHGTVAGLIQRELGRIPKPGDTVDVGQLRLTVETVERRRVRRVQCERLNPDELEMNGTGVAVSTGNQHTS